MMDEVGNKAARREIAMIKAVVPPMALKIIDRAIQLHGGAGVCEDFPLANFWIVARMLRIADGPDEVHLESIAKMELKSILKLTLYAISFDQFESFLYKPNWNDFSIE